MIAVARVVHLSCDWKPTLVQREYHLLWLRHLLSDRVHDDLLDAVWEDHVEYFSISHGFVDWVLSQIQH